MIRLKGFIFLLLGCYTMAAQDTLLKQGVKHDYRPREEIIHYGKRYRIHNNYLTLGGGFLNSSIRDQSQKNIGTDFTFHIREQHFQVGLMMSGEDWLSNNHVQLHVGYGYRYETNTSNLAVFAGPAYFTGVTAFTDPVTGANRPDFYDGYGAYVCVQGITKFYYDFGLGLELFGDFSYKQQMFGFRIIAFFSGAYRGVKKNYNPNVRSENP